MFEVEVDSAGLPVGFVVVDLNETFADIVGVCRDSLIDAGPGDLGIVPEADVLASAAAEGTRSEGRYYSKARDSWYRSYVYPAKQSIVVCCLFEIPAPQPDYEHHLAAVSIALNTSSPDAVDNALSSILSFSNASRVYICSNSTDRNGDLSMRRIYEVCAEGVEPQIDNPHLQHASYEEHGFGRWRSNLSLGNPIHGRVADFPPEERDILEPQGIGSVLALPIDVDQQWFGFVGFDDVRGERSWSEDGIRLLQPFSRMLGRYFERREAEQKVLSAKEQFELAVRGSNDGIWDWNLQTNELFFSERWKSMLGYGDDELPNSFDTFLRLLSAEDKDRVQQYVAEYLEGKHEKYDAQFRMQHKDGSYRWIRARGEALFRDDGTPYRMAGSHTDITSERESTERMQLADRIISAGSASIFLWKNEENWPVEYVSGNVESILGYSPREFLEGTLSYTEIIHPDDLERVVDEVRRASQDPSVEEFVHEPYRILTPDNETRWLEDRSRVVRSGDGAITHYQKLVLDITEKVESERLLREREAQFRTVFYRSPYPMALSELVDGRIIDVNDAFCRAVEVSREDLLGRTPTELNFYSPADRKRFTDELIGNGSVNGMVMEFTTFDNRRLHARVNGTFITVQEQKRILTIFEDITERKKTEDALRESEEKFRSFVENANDILYSLSKDAVFTYVSPRWKQILGHEPEEVVGTGIDRYVHPDDLQKCSDFLARVLQTKEKQHGVEYRVRHKDGSWRWHMSNASPLMRADGEVDAYLGIARDITEKKRDEEELLAAKENAEIANRAKSEFLANMSHEIRTPMHAVIGFSQLLQDTPLSRVQKEYADNVNSSAQMLLGIINDILDFSKIEAGKFELECIRTDMVRLLEQSIDIIKFPAAKKGIEVLFDIDPRMPRFAVTDSVRLTQILANLLGNAVKFTESGEIELQVRFESIDATRGRFDFAVRDTGIGISEVQRKRLFKAFSQADSSTTRQFGGSGLGLIISDSIAVEMGGKLHLASTPGKGSVFSFSLETEYEYGKKDDSRDIEDIHRCLVIDDNANNRTILQQLLHSWGIDVTGCEDGFESLKLIERSEPFDVIICDYHMPYINGLETIRMMREKLMLPPGEPPIIFLHSSSDDAGVHEECKRLDVHRWLTKPVKPLDLLNVLRDRDSIHDGSSPVRPSTREAAVDIHDGETTEKGFGTPGSITILIAEDNPTNMLLAKSIVQRAVPSATIVEAGNGKEAVELAARTEPSIIFMDVQMPELDGNDATTAIRRREEEAHASKTPIIGLTAGAMKEERERSLAAGMDDFVTKPIDIEKLRGIVQRYLGSDASKRFDKRGFAEAVADRDLMQELLRTAKAEVPQRIASMEKALATKAYDEVFSLAHMVKGSALLLRCDRLAEAAAELERTVKSNEVDEAPRALQKLREEWRVLLPMLNIEDQ